MLSTLMLSQPSVKLFFKIAMEAGKPEVIKIPFSIKGTRRGDPKPVLLRDGKPVDMEKLKNLVEVVINGDVAEIKFKVSFLHHYYFFVIFDKI